MRIRLSLLCLLVLFFAACGEEQYAPRTQTATKTTTGGITGILLNAQQMEKNVDAAERKVQSWEVADDSGLAIFGSDMIDPEFQRLKGVKYAWKRKQALEGSSLHLGKNHREYPVREVKVTGEGKDRKATFVVGSSEASELRSLPNLSQLVRQANIVILVGKIGD
ncbi:MAG: hypothetical protein ACYS99_20200 [Planctomycetota bacterium]|jgi:hypothetical protein